MINEIIRHTNATKDNHSLFKFDQDTSFLQQLNYEKKIENRQSFRLFDSGQNIIANKDEIRQLFELLTQLINKIFRAPQAIELAIVDNKGIIDSNTEPTIYIFENRNFKKVETRDSLTRENLFIQEEMHDCDGVIFFLWNLAELPKKNLESGRFYKEIIMMSGLLGQIISEYAEVVSWKGTMFAGVMEADWRAIVSEKYSNKKPIFAYGFQKYR